MTAGAAFLSEYAAVFEVLDRMIIYDRGTRPTWCRGCRACMAKRMVRVEEELARTEGRQRSRNQHNPSSYHLKYSVRCILSQCGTVHRDTRNRNCVGRCLRNNGRRAAQMVRRQGVEKQSKDMIESYARVLIIVHLANTFGPPPPNVQAMAGAGQLQWLLVI